jgi:gas vesicle protein
MRRALGLLLGALVGAGVSAAMANAPRRDRSLRRVGVTLGIVLTPKPLKHQSEPNQEAD